MAREISLLKLKLSKWKYHARQCEKGMSSLYEDKKAISALKEKWAEELFFHKIHWEKLQEELKELRKYKSMQKEKEQMYTLNKELFSHRYPSPYYPIFLFE